MTDTARTYSTSPYTVENHSNDEHIAPASTVEHSTEQPPAYGKN